MTFFSVIIPNYNHHAFLHERIESVVKQTYPYFEVIILDDASTDDSKNIIEKYSNHPQVAQIVYNTRNSGSPFKQWQKGATLAKGNWLWIAESDDVADENFLAKAAEAIDQHTFGLFYSDAFLIDKDGNVYNKASIL